MQSSHCEEDKHVPQIVSKGRALTLTASYIPPWKHSGLKTYIESKGKELMEESPPSSL